VGGRGGVADAHDGVAARNARGEGCGGKKRWVTAPKRGRAAACVRVVDVGSGLIYYSLIIVLVLSGARHCVVLRNQRFNGPGPGHE